MRSLLAEMNMTEQDAYNLCEKYGLLSPSYALSSRGGCWFCPNATVKQYAMLKQNHPELYMEFVGIGIGNPLLCSCHFRYSDTIESFDKKVCDYIKKKESQDEINFK